MSITYAVNAYLVKFPPQVKIGNNLYRTVTINGLIWTAENIKESIPNVQQYTVDGETYYRSNDRDTIDAYAAQYGFRLPTRTEAALLFANVSGNSLSTNETKCKENTDVHDWNGLSTGLSTFNFKPLQALNEPGNLVVNSNYLKWGVMHCSDSGASSFRAMGCVIRTANPEHLEYFTDTNGGWHYSLRLCRNA